MTQHSLYPSPRRRSAKGVLTVGICCLVPACDTRSLEVATTHNQQGADDRADKSYLYDAGDVMTGQSVRHVFPFRNPLPAPICLADEQGVHTTCGCTRVQVADKRLLPGQATAVAMEVRTTNRLGVVSERATVQWTTRHGATHEVTFAVRGRVRPALAFAPPELSFSKEAVSYGKTQTVWCEALVPIKDWEDVSVDSDASHLEVVRVHRHPINDQLGIDVRCRPTHQGGGRRASVIVHNAHTKSPWTAKLPVFSEDTTKLQCMPPVMSLREQGNGRWTGIVVVTGDALDGSAEIADVMAVHQSVRYTTQRLSTSAVRLRVHMSMTPEAVDTSPHTGISIQLTNGQSLRVPWKCLESNTSESPTHVPPEQRSAETSNVDVLHIDRMMHIAACLNGTKQRSRHFLRKESYS